MPELATFYIAGFIISGVFGIVFGFQMRAKYHSASYLMLQRNLGRINSRWNDLNLSIEAVIDPTQQQSEYNKARLTSIAIVFLGMILSWLGTLLLIVLWVSLKLVGNSRIEKKLYSSRLVEKDLSIDEIHKQIELLELQAKK